MTKINIANDFSVYPGGRYRKDGDYSGEEFRESLLLPAFENNDKVEIELDGTRGYGSSFLEESFGGLVRRGYKAAEVIRKLVFITKKENLIIEILSYIHNAELCQN